MQKSDKKLIAQWKAQIKAVEARLNEVKQLSEHLEQAQDFRTPDWHVYEAWNYYADVELALLADIKELEQKIWWEMRHDIAIQNAKKNAAIFTWRVKA